HVFHIVHCKGPGQAKPRGGQILTTDRGFPISGLLLRNFASAQNCYRQGEVPNMPLGSYAQNPEDVLLYPAPSGPAGGFYIDVGANDPTACSISKCFYDLGWHGINIEPVRGVFQRLAGERTRDINLNVGLSNSRQSLTFYECLNESTLS